MNFLKFKNKNLFFENIAVSKIASRIKTPFYLYSFNQLKLNFNNFKKSFKKVNPLICFSVKSNSNVKIISELKKLGSGADVVSLGELKIALKAGIIPKKIVFSGVGKTEEELDFAIKRGVLLINAESESEIKTINKIAKKNNKTVAVGIRINPNISAKTNKKISTGKKDNKFGVSMNACLQIFNHQYHYEYIKFEAISVHIGSQIMDVNPFKKVLSSLSSFNKKINLLGINLKYIDLGGGTGIPYSESEKVFNLQKYSNLVLKFKKINNVEIIFEPGRSICGNTGVLVSKIIYLKDIPGKKFIIIDAAMNDLMRPALYGAKHEIYPLLKNNSIIKKNTEFVGPVCESSDTFMSYNNYQKLNEGDFICINNIGAYGRSLASNYNTRPYSAEVLINKNTYKIIKQRQKLESLIN
jgi:diaminopimelate decarboxylase